MVSFGTEGRRPDDEVLPSDNVYEYIVFRGSDVKDLRIEEPPKENKPPKPPQVPDDPAILGVRETELQCHFNCYSRAVLRFNEFGDEVYRM